MVVFAIGIWVWTVGYVLGFYWWRMVISVEGFDCIDRHGNVYPSFDVVPLKIDASV